MNKSAFLELIKKASNITDQQTEELEKVAAAFPYCQTAHLLLAKSAFEHGSMLSAQRLRKASSYATDRQVLKRVIHAQPVLEPAFADDLPEPEEDQAAEAIEATFAEAEDTPQTSIEAVAEVPAIEEAPAPEEPTTEIELLPETDSPARTESQEEEEEAVASEQHDFDSELAMLLTLNSLSSSSTDLLEHKTPLLLPASLPVSPAEDGSVSKETPEASTADEPMAAPGTLAIDVAFVPAAETEYTAESSLYAEDEEVAEQETPSEDFQADISYSSSEIDRLYLEDVLGYGLSSSRMGEVLQVKDQEFTRAKPRGFHPELILEYSKTHELEKTAEPIAPVLNQELDIIDQFLKLNPRLKTMANFKVKAEPQEDLSLKSTKIKKGIASESLASIFLNQGKVKKAIKIYEQLILKNPEKKVYFAEQIEKLQNLT